VIVIELFAGSRSISLSVDVPVVTRLHRLGSSRGNKMKKTLFKAGKTNKSPQHHQI
jgi:hypothetical protein